MIIQSFILGAVTLLASVVALSDGTVASQLPSKAVIRQPQCDGTNGYPQCFCDTATCHNCQFWENIARLVYENKLEGNSADSLISGGVANARTAGWDDAAISQYRTIVSNAYGRRWSDEYQFGTVEFNACMMASSNAEKGRITPKIQTQK